MNCGHRQKPLVDVKTVVNLFLLFIYLQQYHGKQAPPPPKRNPETRLSTASISSVSDTKYRTACI